jgi:putative transposase
MARKSVIPKLSEVQKNILLAITKRRDSSQQLVRRARVVLLAAEQQTDIQITPQVDLCQRSVWTWRTRWNAFQEKIDAVEADGNEKALKEFITDVVLADDPYNGERGIYTPEQITQLYAIVCENPQDSGRPISHWSCRELAEEMVKRGIVEHIPISTVWDFLKSRRAEASQGARLAEPKVRRSGRIPKAE